MIRKRPLLLLLLLGVFLPGLAAADKGHKPGKESRHRSDNAALHGRKGESLDTVVSRIRRQTGGRILSAETIHYKGRSVHRIRILTREGKVRRMQVDARSGRLLPPPGRRR